MDEAVQLANRLTGLHLADRVGSEHVERWIKIMGTEYRFAEFLKQPRDPVQFNFSNIDEFNGIRIPAPRTKRDLDSRYSTRGSHGAWRDEQDKIVITSSDDPEFISLKDLIIGAPDRPALNPDVILYYLIVYPDKDDYEGDRQLERDFNDVNWKTDISWDEYNRRREYRFMEMRNLVNAPGVTYAGEVAKILLHFVYLELDELVRREDDEKKSFQRLMNRQLTGRGKMSKTGNVFDKNLSKLVKEIAKLTKDKREKAKLKTIINSISRQYKKLYNEKAAQDAEIAELRAQKKL